MTDEAGETAENETQDGTLSSETAVTPSHDDDEVIEGEIVDGTWINPSIPADDPRRTAQTAQITYTLPEGKPSFMRMIFGSVVILSEEVTERASMAGEEDLPRQMVEAAMHQAAQQQQALDSRKFANLRYGAIGLASGVLDKTQGGAGRISGLTHAAATTAGKIIGPVWNSFLFAPFHDPAMKAEQAGETKVNEWIRRGRVEEVRSRALAEVSISNFVEESVNELTENEQIQMIVQEVIASQSTSLIGELLDEARERLVSLDIVLMGKLRRNLVAGPDFRDAYLQELEQKRVRYKRGELNRSLAGTYAGPMTRLVAFLLDVLILIIAVGLISSFTVNAIELFGLSEVINLYLTSAGPISTGLVILVTAFNFLVVSCYFIFSWNWTGATIGDIVFGLRVVDRQGGRVSFLRSLMRLIGAYISAAVLFIGFIWALFDGRRQGWHDKFGATYVLYDWPAKPDEHFLNSQVMTELDDAGLS
jgi:uncharacterized RDD family membrane protein YckC